MKNKKKIIVLVGLAVALFCSCGKQINVEKEIQVVSEEKNQVEEQAESVSNEVESAEINEKEIETETDAMNQVEPENVGISDSAEEKLSDDAQYKEHDNVVIEDISWNHDENMPYDDPTEIYFKLSSGEEITKEIIFGTTVEGMDELDIDGDGEDEIVIRQYFLNTVTEYSVINIYKLIDGQVEEIYPGNKEPELEGELINTEIVPLEEEGLPKYMLDATIYQKDEGMVSEKYHGNLVWRNDAWEDFKPAD